jgi:hypothetical protein
MRQDTYELWQNIVKGDLTAKDWGYLALFVSIVKNKSPKQAIIDIKGYVRKR